MNLYKIILPVLLVMAMACGQKKEVAAEKAATARELDRVQLTREQAKSIGIQTGNPLLEKISGRLLLQGKIDVPPQSMVSLSFPLGGYLRYTSMLPGAHVRKGQVLGVMEDMQFIQLQQDYLTAQERLNLAIGEYNRQKELNMNKAASDKVFQQARAEMETQKIMVNALRQKLHLIGINPERLNAANISRTVNVVSPIDGYVAKVNVNVGKYTAPTDMLFELVDPSDIHLNLSVFEKDLAALSVGQEVVAYGNSNPARKYAATVILISRSLDENKMAEVHCHFKDYDAGLVPGMFMNGEVATTTREALTVPEDAIVRWENKYYVFIVSGDGYEMKEVETGISRDGRQQILAKGITNTTQVVTRNAYALLMKLKNTEE